MLYFKGQSNELNRVCKYKAYYYNTLLKIISPLLIFFD